MSCRAFLAAAALCLASLCAAAEFDPYSGPKPIAIFIQSNPWGGADTPWVAIYEDGEVVFRKKVKERYPYHQVVLGKPALARLLGQFKPMLALKDLKPGYDMAPGVTDQPVAMFYIRDGDREVTTQVYGLMPPDTRLPAYTVFSDRPGATIPPKAVLDLHKRLCVLDFANSRAWTPKYYDVILWDFSYAQGGTVPWPKDWPSLTSERALKRGDSYSIFLDASMRSRLADFLGSVPDGGAVEIEGRKMAVSWRNAFPGETVWLNAFTEARNARK